MRQAIVGSKNFVCHSENVTSRNLNEPLHYRFQMLSSKIRLWVTGVGMSASRVTLHGGFMLTLAYCDTDYFQHS